MEPSDYYRSSAIKWSDNSVYFVVTKVHQWDKGKYLCSDYPYAVVLKLLRPDFWELSENIFGSDKLSVEDTTTILEGHGFTHNTDLDDFLKDYLDEWVETEDF